MVGAAVVGSGAGTVVVGAGGVADGRDVGGEEDGCCDTSLAVGWRVLSLVVGAALGSS